ncbi:hypothetical protein [Oerskovia enterophila]|uniref:hypothetical protein n=1 Tax=Oerskovia enterophila TaxID=43678 RepID=UPI003827F266
MSDKPSAGGAKSAATSKAQRKADAERAEREEMYSFAPEILGVAAPLPRKVDGSERVAPRTDR